MPEKITIGRRFDRWTVIGPPIMTPKGEAKWLCRCKCGTVRHVLARSLTTKKHPSRSCGCLRREALREAISHDLHGMFFEDLEVLGVAEHRNDNGNVWWRCKCSCGEICEYPGSLLVTGRRTHCPSPKHKRYAYKDITGQTIGNLTALYRIPGNQNGSSMWHCRCELCGGEVDYSYNTIRFTDVQSCGCQKKRHDAALPKLLTHTNGTSIDHLRSKKIPSSNTTGAKGVYRKGEKFFAKLVFQQKQYQIGTFSSFQDAVKAREEAEHRVFDVTVEAYNRWKETADADPQWAEQHPFQVVVDRDQNGTLYARILSSVSPVFSAS